MSSDLLYEFEPTQVTLFQNPQFEENLTFERLCNGVFTRDSFERARGVITEWPNYEPTPLIALEGLAQALGVRSVLYKDESPRFAMDSFKSLGGAYAVYCLLVQRVSERTGISQVSRQDLTSGRYKVLTKDITVASATDGNHGRSVAWGAQEFGCRCVIYIHAEVSKGREQILRGQGAEVIRVSGNYDESVIECARDAEENGWYVVSDTSWEGYINIPIDIMNGYSVVAGEVANELDAEVPTHVFVQAGVGGLAASVCGKFAEAWGPCRPRFVVVEPDFAACLLKSARQGRPTVFEVEQETVMAGLSCGEVSLAAWPILARGANDFIAIPDVMVAPAMRLLASSPYGDEPIVAGESAVAGLAALIAVCRDRNLSAALGLNKKSLVLLIGTEGASDPQIYKNIIGNEVASNQSD